MKRLRMFFALMGLLLTVHSVQAQQKVVTMDKDGFYYQGAPWYATNVNMEIMLLRELQNSHPDTRFLPVPTKAGCEDGCFYNTYGSYQEFLYAELQEVKNAGFNSIRIAKLAEIRYDYLNEHLSYPWVEGQSWLGPIKVVDDYAASGTSFPQAIEVDDILDGLGYFLDVCEQVDLKAIVLLGSGGVMSENGQQPYFDYLEKVGTRFKDHPAVMAWDLNNEPTLGAYHYHKAVSDPNWAGAAAGDVNEVLTKKHASEFTRDCYDAIKSVDRHHLVTFGLGAYGLERYDPGVVKADFISYHIYPRGFLNTFQSDPEGRHVRGFLAWNSLHMKRPWMIGETSLPGSGTARNQSEVDNCLELEPEVPALVSYEHQQKTFAELVMNDCRDCGGLGLGWWKFSRRHLRRKQCN